MESQSFSVAYFLKAKAIFELTKFRLSSTVVFSSCIGFSLAANQIDWLKLVFFAIGAFLITASANIINQIKEIELDKLMSRTYHRPLPDGRISVNEAILVSFIFGISGLSIIVFGFNIKAGILSLISLILYGFIYTPLKRVGPIAVAVGALPGAFPPMIGWVASSGTFGLEPGILFAIQFFWQFPHFWAIAWVLDDDYKKAGFKLLPSKGGQDLNSAIQITIYTLFLLPLCWVPYYLGMTGINSAFVAMVCGIFFTAQTLHLMRERSKKAATRLMFGSFLYLPIVQIAYLMDKI
ncbi:MAG: protoheme IX farnesyltransferase [Cytophagaceae bacterium]|nr:protoheme IX farnesyltransferase [Cytophagaceae bacterium]MBK9935196.1 protoheme IX farnesyltransferase [Cytophagaceae bacterium]MBL0324464.1 protoheme IX farnesyltransferase [Cytophagaceae bacterium]